MASETATKDLRQAVERCFSRLKDQPSLTQYDVGRSVESASCIHSTVHSLRLTGRSSKSRRWIPIPVLSLARIPIELSQPRSIIRLDRGFCVSKPLSTNCRFNGRLSWARSSMICVLPSTNWSVPSPCSVTVPVGRLSAKTKRPVSRFSFTAREVVRAHGVARVPSGAAKGSGISGEAYGHAFKGYKHISDGILAPSRHCGC